MNKLKALFFIPVLALAASASAQSVKVTARIDSVEVRQGMLRQIDIEVVQPDDMTLQWSVPELKADTIIEIYPGIEAVESTEITRTQLGNNRTQLLRTLLIQPWDSGEYVIKDLYVTNGTDTFRANPIVLKVIPAVTDTMTTIHEQYMPAVEIRSHFFDFLPDWIYNYWWAWIAGIVAVTAGILIALRYRRGGTLAVKAKPVHVVPPYEKAMAQLAKLQADKLWEKGQEKQFYTSLTDILREYLEGRFGINALEMTTPQIKRAVYATVPEKSASAMMNDILEMADYVKFAKMRPLPEDNMRSFNQASEFIENTRPMPQTEGKEERK